jgi:hypothetical protein
MNPISRHSEISRKKCLETVGIEADGEWPWPSPWRFSAGSSALGQALEHHVYIIMSFYFSYLFFSVDDGIQSPTRTMAASGAEKPRAHKPSARVMEEEGILMQALADKEKDACPDDGAIEIDLDEEYQ